MDTVTGTVLIAAITVVGTVLTTLMTLIFARMGKNAAKLTEIHDVVNSARTDLLERIQLLEQQIQGNGGRVPILKLPNTVPPFSPNSSTE